MNYQSLKINKRQTLTLKPVRVGILDILFSQITGQKVLIWFLLRYLGVSR